MCNSAQNWLTHPKKMWLNTATAPELVHASSGTTVSSTSARRIEWIVGFISHLSFGFTFSFSSEAECPELLLSLVRHGSLVTGEPKCSASQEHAFWPCCDT